MRGSTLAVAVFCFATGSALMPAAQVGTIYACYACANTGNSAVDTYLTSGPGGTSVSSDGLLFAFWNSGSTPITNAAFSVSGSSSADVFKIGTIAADSTFILVPGVTSDGGTHPSNGFFNSSQGVLDTSDGAGNITDSSVWSFTGTDAGQSVTSGNITAGESSLLMPFINPTVSGSMVSFIGQGPSGDGGCNVCYFGPIASLASSSSTGGGGGSAVPEPADFSLIALGIGVIACFARSRRSV